MTLWAFFCGALTALMIHLNGQLAAALGNQQASVLIHLSGLLLVLLLLVRRRWSLWRPGIPLWWYGGGVVGMLIVVLANVGFLRLGVTLTAALGLLGQTASAMLVDHYGWLGVRRRHFDARKWPCLALIAVGIVVMAY